MLNRREFVASAAAAALSPLLGGVANARTVIRASANLDPWLEIDSAALAHNVRATSALAGGKPIIAVAKNNAYGLGLATAGPLFDRLPEVQLLAVVRPDEAFALRHAGVRKPLLLMGPATEDELLELVPLDVIQSPYRAAAPTILGRVSGRLKRPVRVHLYVDTGMHRMGMPVAEARVWLACREICRRLICQH